MKNEIDLERVYDDFVSGKSTKNATFWNIAQFFIVSHPSYLPLDYDNKMDFLLYNYNRIFGIISRFKKSAGAFTVFLRYGLLKEIRTWKRKIAIKSINESYTYYALAAEKEIYGDCECSVEEEIAERECVYRKNPFEDVRKKDREETKKMKLIMHILALKACYYITDFQISCVAKFCGIKIKKLLSEIDALKKMLDRKISARERKVYTRDNAFYFRRKYEYEMQNVKNGFFDCCDFEYLERGFEKNTKRWLDRIKILGDQNMLKISPSYNEIGIVLGVGGKKIEYDFYNAAKDYTIEHYFE